MTEKTQLLYRYLLPYPSLAFNPNLTPIFSVYFGVKALKVFGPGLTELIHLELLWFYHFVVVNWSLRKNTTFKLFTPDDSTATLFISLKPGPITFASEKI